MKWIGLTGGLGTGKSTVAELLRGLGYAVVDADKLAHQAVAKNSPGLQSVIKEFGSSVTTKGGELDREALAKIVFQSKDNLAKLEAIVHPIVRSLSEQERKKLEASGKSVAFYDVPLLFEKNMQTLFDAVVVVKSSQEKQFERLRARNSWDDEEIKRRLANQLALPIKERQASYVIQNNAGMDELKAEVAGMIAALQLPAP